MWGPGNEAGRIIVWILELRFHFGPHRALHNRPKIIFLGLRVSRKFCWLSSLRFYHVHNSTRIWSHSEALTSRYRSLGRISIGRRGNGPRPKCYVLERSTKIHRPRLIPAVRYEVPFPWHFATRPEPVRPTLTFSRAILFTESALWSMEGSQAGQGIS